MGSGDLGDDLHQLFVHVQDRRSITVVIEVDLDERLGILGKPEEDVEDGGFLSEGERRQLEDRQEDFVQKDFDLFLFVFIFKKTKSAR